jgi:hypothetical protein
MMISRSGQGVGSKVVMSPDRLDSTNECVR